MELVKSILAKICSEMQDFEETVSINNGATPN